METGLDSHPDAATLIGTIVSRWTLIEHCFCRILQRYLNVDQVRAEIVFYSINSMPSRCSLILRLAKSYGENDDIKSISAFIRRAKKLGKTRNLVAHCAFTGRDENGSFQFEQIHFVSDDWTPDFPIIAESELRTAADAIYTLYEDMTHFSFGFHHIHGQPAKWRGPHPSEK